MRGLGESLFHRRRIAFLPCQADIVGRLLVKTRRTGRQCRSEVDDWVERRVADIDALDCVERSIRIFGDDHRYRLADVSHTPGGKGRTGRAAPRDRKSVVSGKSVSVRRDLGGRRIIKKKKKQ